MMTYSFMFTVPHNYVSRSLNWKNTTTLTFKQLPDDCSVIGQSKKHVNGRK